MSKLTKSRSKAAAPSQKKPETELDEKALEQVSGGKGCAGGEHIKEGVITTH